MNPVDAEFALMVDVMVLQRAAMMGLKIRVRRNASFPAGKDKRRTSVTGENFILTVTLFLFDSRFEQPSQKCNVERSG
jgi:hypothetical protein